MLLNKIKTEQVLSQKEWPHRFVAINCHGLSKLLIISSMTSDSVSFAERRIIAMLDFKERKKEIDGRGDFVIEIG